MLPLNENLPWITETRYLGPARVLGIPEQGSFIRVQLDDTFENRDIQARKAIPFTVYPGDTVLVMGEDPDHMYIIGILEQDVSEKTSGNSIVLDNGTHATRDSHRLKVFSGKQELLFEYDEKNETARINLESGNMEFITRNGNISFAAGKDILLNGRTVGITSRTGILMGILDTLGKLRSTFTMKTNNVQLKGQEVSVEAQKGDLQIKEATFTGERLAADFDSSRITVNRLETVARTILCKAKNVYSTVEQLSQLKTGRMRTLVEDTFHLKSRKSMLKSDEDFKVRAEKIHLG